VHRQGSHESMRSTLKGTASMHFEHTEAGTDCPDEQHLDSSDPTVVDEPFHKTHDFTYHFTACDGSGSSCHIEIYTRASHAPVILCPAPPTPSAPGYWMVECLAAEVVRRHFPQAFEAIGEPFIWLECCPSVPDRAPTSYVWVTFDSYAPRWVEHACGVRHVTLRQARRLAVDRATVEGLIGRLHHTVLPGPAPDEQWAIAARGDGGRCHMT
jgi:hypothetical protein